MNNFLRSLSSIFVGKIKWIISCLLMGALLSTFFPLWYHSSRNTAEAIAALSNRQYSFSAGTGKEETHTDFYLLADGRFMVLHWQWDEECEAVDFHTAVGGRWICDYRGGKIQFYLYPGAHDNSAIVILSETEQKSLVFTDALLEGTDPNLYGFVLAQLNGEYVPNPNIKPAVKASALSVDGEEFKPDFFARGCFKLQPVGASKVNFTTEAAVASLTSEQKAYARAYLLSKYRYEIEEPDLMKTFYQFSDKSKVVFTGLQEFLIQPMLTASDRHLYRLLAK